MQIYQQEAFADYVAACVASGRAAVKRIALLYADDTICAQADAECRVMTSMRAVWSAVFSAIGADAKVAAVAVSDGTAHAIVETKQLTLDRMTEITVNLSLNAPQEGFSPLFLGEKTVDELTVTVNGAVLPPTVTTRGVAYTVPSQTDGYASVFVNGTFAVTVDTADTETTAREYELTANCAVRSSANRVRFQSDANVVEGVRWSDYDEVTDSIALTARDWKCAERIGLYAIAEDNLYIWRESTGAEEVYTLPSAVTAAGMGHDAAFALSGGAVYACGAAGIKRLLATDAVNLAATVGAQGSYVLLATLTDAVAYRYQDGTLTKHHEFNRTPQFIGASNGHFCVYSGSSNGSVVRMEPLGSLLLRPTAYDDLFGDSPPRVSVEGQILSSHTDTLVHVYDAYHMQSYDIRRSTGASAFTADDRYIAYVSDGILHVCLRDGDVCGNECFAYLLQGTVSHLYFLSSGIAAIGATPVYLSLNGAAARYVLPVFSGKTVSVTEENIVGVGDRVLSLTV